jgi:hypothetical protein
VGWGGVGWGGVGWGGVKLAMPGFLTRGLHRTPLPVPLPPTHQPTSPPCTSALAHARLCPLSLSFPSPSLPLRRQAHAPGAGGGGKPLVLVLAPTRELALQIHSVLEEAGSACGVRCEGFGR